MNEASQTAMETIVRLIAIGAMSHKEAVESAYRIGHADGVISMCDRIEKATVDA